MGGFAEGGDVADLHGGVAGGFEPEEFCAFEVLGLGVVCRGCEAEGDAHLAEVLLGEDAGGVVGVGGEDDDVAGAQDCSEDRGAGCHARGEDQGAGTVAGAGLHLCDGFFEVGPGGVVRAGVGVGGVGGVAGGVVGRGKDWAREKRLACDGVAEGGADDSGGVSHRGNGVDGSRVQPREKCSQPAGSSAVWVPSGAIRVINGCPERRGLMEPIRVTGTPAMEDGIRTEAGAVKRSS